MWGTTVNVQLSIRAFREFVKKFVPAESMDGTPLYLKLVEENLETQNNNLNVNGFHLFSHNPNLYEDMIRYPREMLPIFDLAVQELVTTEFSNLATDQVRPMQVRFESVEEGDED